MEDQSGLEPTADGFVTLEDFPSTLTALLEEMGRTYVPVMIANAAAVDAGRESTDTAVEGQPWTQEPFPYQAKCLQWIRVEYARLDESDRERVDHLLVGTGCEQLVARP
jgi:hypothetical protein